MDAAGIATDPATGRLQQDRLEEQRLSPARFVASIRAVFDEVKQSLITEAARQESDAAASATQQHTRCVEGVEALVELAETDTVEVDNHEIPAFIPYGVGQFTNGNESLGLFFGISEGFLTLLSFASMIGSAVTPEMDGDYEALGQTFFYGNIVLNVALAVLVVAGIIESRAAWQPTRRVTQEREVPEELDPVHLCGSPEAGIALCF